MLLEEEKPTILDSAIVNPSVEQSLRQDLTDLIRDFPIKIRGISGTLHIPRAEMAWQLRTLPLKGYGCFFIILSNAHLLRETEISTYSREYPRIFLGSTNSGGGSRGASCSRTYQGKRKSLGRRQLYS